MLLRKSRAKERLLRDQFGQIAEADWQHLYRAAIKAGADEREAEDIVQDALLRAFSALSKMSDDRLANVRVHSWLTALARKAARDHLTAGNVGR